MVGHRDVLDGGEFSDVIVLFLHADRRIGLTFGHLFRAGKFHCVLVLRWSARLRDRRATVYGGLTVSRGEEELRAASALCNRFTRHGVSTMQLWLSAMPEYGWKDTVLDPLRLRCWADRADLITSFVLFQLYCFVCYHVV